MRDTSSQQSGFFAHSGTWRSPEITVSMTKGQSSSRASVKGVRDALLVPDPVEVNPLLGGE